MKEELTRKYEKLKKLIRGYVSGSIVVAFSGGVDSALLLKLTCQEAGKDSIVYAVTAQTKLHPAGDLENAKRMAEEFGAEHKVLYLDELAEYGIETNPVNRCYLCKRGIFQNIKNLAEEVGADCILEGTNADDLQQYRPGIQALRELQIISPLCECGLTKSEIRELAEYLGISAAKRPSTPCLATRLPYGTRISYELLARIDEGERYLRELGFYNVRLRVHELTVKVNAKDSEKPEEEGIEWLARIEVDREDISRLLDYREELAYKIKRLGFDRVTVDLEGFRSGSMDRITEEMMG